MHMTPARMAQAALRVACVMRSPNMQHWAGVLACDMLAPPGYERPTGSRLQGASERQGMPAMPHSEDLLVPASVQEIAPHVQWALGLDHPLENVALHASPVLRAAVQYVASFRGPGAAGAIAADREARWSRWCAARRGLAAEQRELERIRAEFCEPTVAAGAPPAEIATFAACMLAGGWPDVGYTLCQVVGFPCVGDYKDSGVFRPVEQPATVRPGELANEGQIAAVERALAGEAERASVDAERREALEYITRATREEVAPPPGSEKPSVAAGPFTKEEVDAKLGRREWRPLQRFVIDQGVKEDGSRARRVCDNCKSSRTNEMLGVHETISCEDPSFPILVAHLFAEAFGHQREALVHATDDVAAAYRQLRCAHPEYTVVAIWDTIEGGVRYYTMYGHNFGLKSAVLSFNRHTQLISWVARNWFGVCNAAYFDDVDTTEPAYCGATGKKVLHDLAAVAGTPFAASKDKPFARARTFLGVLVDLTDYVGGSAQMLPKPGRVDKIVASVKAILRSDKLPSGVCANLCGKVEYTASSGACGRVGRAPLSALRAWQHRRSKRRDDEPLPEWLKEALRFFVELLPVLPGRKFFFGEKRRKRRPVVVYTDAMYDSAKTPAGMVGIVIYDPEDPEHKWRYASSGVTDEIISRFRPREQYVGQLEVLAAVAAYTSRPAQLRDRDVIHFIDNVGAYSGLGKGYSPDMDSARMISVFHTMNAALRSNVWFEYVPSKANISDLPSRNEFELLHSSEYKAEPFELVWPPLSAWTGEYGAVFALYSDIRQRRSRKRAAPA